MSSLFRISLTVGLSVAMCACASIRPQASDGSDSLYPEGPEMKAIQFETGRPLKGDTLSRSMQHPEITIQLLRDDFKLIKLLPNEKFRVVGATDDMECVQNECVELSRRRAEAVIEWLVGQGIPASQLAPDVRGPYMGVDHRYTEGDRRVSRRVDIEIVATDADGAISEESDVAVQNAELPPLLSAPEIAAIQFRSGLPLAGKSLESALEDPDFYLKSLRRDVEVIRRYPQIKFEIVGFTDAAECHAAQCQSLAANRAQLVYDWLLANGVPAASLKGPVSRGSAMPLDRGDTEQGRARNRRVEINLSPD